jgi:hypothetical protein
MSHGRVCAGIQSTLLNALVACLLLSGCNRPKEKAPTALKPQSEPPQVEAWAAVTPQPERPQPSLDAKPNVDAVAAEKTNEPLHIKGFYIGMPIEEAATLINSKYRSIFISEEGYYNVVRWHDREDEVAALQALGALPSRIVTNHYTMTTESWYFTNAFVYSDASNSTWRVGPSYGNSLGAFALGPFDYGDNVLGPVDNTDFNVSGGSDKRVSLIVLSPRIVGPLFNAADMSTEDFVQAMVENYHLGGFQREFRPSGEPLYCYTSPVGFKIVITSDKHLIITRVPASTERKFD